MRLFTRRPVYVVHVTDTMAADHRMYRFTDLASARRAYDDLALASERFGRPSRAALVRLAGQRGGRLLASC